MTHRFASAGQVVMSNQLYEQTKASEDVWRELEWTTLHYDDAAGEQRAHLDRVLAAIDRMEDSSWLVWFAYYTQQVNVGIVEAVSAEDACQKFWAEHGDADTWPCSGVHALPAVPGQSAEISGVER